MGSQVRTRLLTHLHFISSFKKFYDLSMHRAGGGGALPYKPIWDVSFFSELSMKIDQKFRNGL